MKKYLSLIISVLLLFALSVSVSADDGNRYLFDDADLLNETQAGEIESLLKEYSEDCGCSILIHTVKSYPADGQTDYAWTFQEDHSDVPDSLLLFINLDDGTGRYLNVYSMGSVIDTVPDLDGFIDLFWEGIPSGDYYGSFEKYADEAYSALSKGENAPSGTDDAADVATTGILPSRSGEYKYMFDDAGTVTESQAREIEALLKEYSEDCGYSILIHTVPSYSAYGQALYAWDFQEEHSDVPDSVILFINLDDGEGRYLNVYSMGKAEKALADEEEIDEFIDEFWDEILNEDFDKAFRKYADEAHSLLGSYETKTYVKRGGISALIGVIAAFIGTSSMKSKLNTVRSDDKAANYVRSGSLVLNAQNDVYLYSNTTRTPRASESSSRSGGGGGGYSSSGTHHSGGSGRHF